MNKILNIDCIKFLEDQSSDIYDLIIADPPYFEINGPFDFVWSDINEYLDWSKKWISNCARTLKNTGSMYIWGAIGYNKGYALPRIVQWIEENKLLRVINWITQRNTRGIGNKKGYIAAREELIFLAKSKNYTWHDAYTQEISTRKDAGFNGKPRKNTHKRCTDVWIDLSEASQSSKERFKLPNGNNFPTVKSLKQCERIIQASSNPGDLVYIPFAGSGSEIVSCCQLGRRYVATEINNDYIQHIIIPRLKSLKTPAQLCSKTNIVGRGLPCDTTISSDGE